jgi:rod shape-determining protein MreC
VTWTSERLVSWHHLLQENTELRAEQLIFNARLQQLDAVIRENNELRTLFNSANTDQHENVHSLVSEIVSVNTDPFDQQFIIDKGTKAGVYIGQPVVDANGVVGQVIDATALGSKILSLTSTRSAIPVVDNRSGVRAIARGEGYTGDLVLVFVPFTSDIQAGDVFVTSGLGLKFPMGYRVGTVKSAERLSTEKFAMIKLEPAAKLDTVKFVLLIWPKLSKVAEDAKALLKT